MINRLLLCYPNGQKSCRKPNSKISLLKTPFKYRILRPMKIYFASGNDHKRQEIQALLPQCCIVLPKEEGIQFDPNENGSTFFENAMIKAQELYRLVQAPVLADDSGLCIDALNGAPGIYSARYGLGEHFPPQSRIDNAGINKVLTELAGQKNRKAHFACCIVFMTGTHRFSVVQEVCEGLITEEPVGLDGFGYDPIFLVSAYGKTFSQMTGEEKNAVSHRGRAAKKISELINTAMRIKEN